MHNLINITPDMQRAKSLLLQVEVRLDAVQLLNKEKHTSLIIEAYYECIKELLTALLCTEGYKALSHTTLLEYCKQYKRLPEHTIHTIDQLRRIRNDIAYEGYKVPLEYYERAVPKAQKIIQELQKKIENCLV